MANTKKTATWKPCDGEAHSNGHIDNCGACAPRWGAIPTCPECGTRLAWSQSRKTGSCIGHGRFAIGETPTFARKSGGICAGCFAPVGTGHAKDCRFVEAVS